MDDLHITPEEVERYADLLREFGEFPDEYALQDLFDHAVPRLSGYSWRGVVWPEPGRRRRWTS